jgi:tetratricopeptide (TPR) repeat protein
MPPAALESNSKTNDRTLSKADYSKEAFVEEEDRTKVDFENDGSYTRESSARIRIQSDPGLQQFSTLKFAYQSAVENVGIDYVRVVKPDGVTVSTPPDSIQDMPADITRQAPFYSDLREKHIAVKGLSVGDVLEMLIHWHSTQPLVPGQFWYSFNFQRDFIVLHQELHVTIPRDRVIKCKSSELNPVISEQGSRRVYAWTRSVLERKSADEQKKQQDKQTYQLARGNLPSPDVQISTFQSWDEIGAWYNKLQFDRVKPSAEVRAKAVELTKGAKDDDARLRAIYAYVSTRIRYIGVAFGVGRYQPHSAAEVLANQYGDCKDKHTLMASLLDAVGIRVYPALINSTHTIDPDVPSPSQFDHVITAVPNGSGFLWLDTTPEVAPYGYLLRLLWDKQALMIPADRPSVMVSTPPEPSVRASETFRIDAKLKDNGTLEGKVERTVSGNDAEVLLRSVFRRTPMENWKQVVQQLSYASGFSGEVSDATASPPDKTDEPFKFSYSYTRKDYPQWSERRISPPLPPMTGIIPDEEPSHPIPTSIGEFRYESRVEVPKGYSPRPPASLDVPEKFAEYHAAYAVEAGVLQTKRTLVIKVREVPADQFNDLKKFFGAVSDDHDVYVSCQQQHITPASYQEAIWALPYSSNTQAAEAYEDARGRYNRGNTAGAVESLRRAVQVDPKFTRAWLWLAEIYLYRHQNESALDALRSAIANDSKETLSYKGLGFALTRLQRYDDSVSAWQGLIKVAPDDPDGPENLGSTLLAAKRYGDAISAFESATKLTPDRAPLYSQLGTAFLRSGNEEEALVVYKKALEKDSTPEMFNDVGYELADADKQLPLSLQYAEKAVHDEEEASTKVKLSELKDLHYSSALAEYWDTLGWVYFRMGVYDKAESYLRSAWQGAQYAAAADHLGQVYEKEQKLAMALHMYNLALEVFPGMEETSARMRNLAHVPLPKNRTSARDELNQMRTIKLPAITKEDVNAYFDVLIVAGKIESAHFVSGSETLSVAGGYLEKSSFEEAFPPNSTAHLFRRGVLSCSEIGCHFVFYPLSFAP